MMPNWLNIGGSAIYAAVIIAALLAWRIARRAGRPPDEARLWLTAAGFFTACAASRLLAFEQAVRGSARSIFEASYAYGERASFQAPLATLAAVALVALFALLIWRDRKRASARYARVLLVAKLGMAAMLGLIALRIISYHPIDSLLYRGLHLNWALDVGLSVAVGWAAWLYRRSLSRYPPQR